MKNQTNDQRLPTNARKQKAKTRTIFAFLFTVSYMLWSVAAYAANYDIKQMTPEVREALAGRQSRYSQLQMAKQSGAVSENNEGLVSGSSPLVSAENNDRLVIYQAIANQNNLGSSGLSQIKRAFAETIREREGR